MKFPFRLSMSSLRNKTIYRRGTEKRRDSDSLLGDLGVSAVRSCCLQPREPHPISCRGKTAVRIERVYGWKNPCGNPWRHRAGGTTVHPVAGRPSVVRGGV